MAIMSSTEMGGELRLAFVRRYLTRSEVTAR
jgi:hypothetical protein